MSAAAAPVAAVRPKVDQDAAPWRRVPLVAVGGTVLAGIALPLVLARISIGDYLITLLILFFMQAVVALHGYRKHPHEGIHPEAYVDPTATVGDGSVIYPGAFVGPHVKVGRDCILRHWSHCWPRSGSGSPRSASAASTSCCSRSHFTSSPVFLL